MVTDDERRLVAERLRMSDERDAAGFVDCLLAEVVRGREFCETPCEECHARLLGELADLIEPSIPADPGEAGLACVDAFIREMRHSTEEERGEYSAMLKKMSVELHPVDRDALLALAKVLGGMGDRYNEHERYELGTTFKAIADRIREACGEVVR